MLKSILISTVMLLFVTGVIFSQTDSPEQKSGLKNTVTTEKPIPQYLLDQLEMAQRTENIEEENRIMNILNSKYLDVTFYNSFLPYNAVVEQGEDEKTHNPPYNPDWLGTDIEVYAHSDNTTNVTNRTLDMKYCMDNGKLYIASCVNIPSWHGIRVFSSSNSGASWVYESGLSNNATYWTGLSMTVEQRADGIPDSVRVNIFYTESNYSGGSDARLGFWSFKPDGTAYHVYKIIGTPTSGYKFVWPSAYSNGNFQSSSTDIGCIVGEYNNAGTTCYQMRQFYMSNFSWIFSITSCNTGWNEFRPSAVYKNDPSGTDSVYIATERRFTTPATYKLRVLKTRYYGGITAAWNYLTITTGTTGYDHNPCLAIEDKLSPTRLVITYTQNNSSSSVYGYGRRSYSLYGGAGTWSEGSLGNSASTSYTWVSCDSTIGTLTSGNCTYLWGDSDSLNVRRSTVSNLGGSTYYDVASYSISSTANPVCAVYNNSSGNHRRSTFAYWRYVNIIIGVKNIYFNAENLPTGITNTNGIANTYNLSQNFPNPFNPTTSINFSIPQNGLVKLVVYDLLGKEVATLVNGEQNAGSYQVTFDASKLNSGVYFYKITSGDFSDVKKMLLVK